MNKKFLILLTLTLSIIIPSYTFAFSDVEGHWAESTINKLSEYDIINGYPDNTFRPDEYMTRAELITVVDELIGIESETDKYISDVSSKDWYYGNVRKALCFGILQGDENGDIMPNGKVTRQEAVLILARAFKLTMDDVVFNDTFDDAKDISSWAKKEFDYFIRRQYITGYGDNTIKPKNKITRAEILTILSRIIKNISSDVSYSLKLNGNTLVRNKNMLLNNVEIYGDLIIGEVAAKTIKLSNVIVRGNLILYAPIDFETNTVGVNGKIINVYDEKTASSLYYRNEAYGISFPIPDGASTYDNQVENPVDYTKKDIIIINIQKDDQYYYKTITELSREEIKKMEYDSIFLRETSGEIENYSYEIYNDNATSRLLVIKRDNIVYSLLFMNVVSSNIIDSVVSNVVFSSGSEITNHENKIYKNSKLALKFTYKNGYVGVDDSYNTNIVYSGDSIFKLFIQVNMITDIEDYSIDEVKMLLKSLIQSDGEIVKEEVKKLYTHHAIQFEIQSGEDKIISLYVIIGNNLYNFIFKGETNAVDKIGKSMFDSIVNSMEF